MRETPMRTALLICLALLPVRLALAIDDVEYTLMEAKNLVKGTSTSTIYVMGVGALKPPEQSDLIKRSAAVPPPVRAIVLYQLASVGNSHAAAAFEKLLKQKGAITGKFKFNKRLDPLRMRDIAYNGWGGKKPELQKLAAGLMLAIWNVPEDPGALAAQVRTIRAPWKSGAATAKQDAVVAVGLLHLRGIRSAASHQALEYALRLQEDPTTRELAANFIGVGGSRRSVGVLLDAMLTEKGRGILRQIVQTLVEGEHYTEKMRVAMMPVFLHRSEDTSLPILPRQWADIALRKLTGRERIQDQRAWLAEREQALGFKTTGKEYAGAASEPPPAATGAAAGPSTPPAGETPPAAAPKKDREPECAMWLLLAKNFLNNKNYDKADEFVKRILETSPDGASAAEARELKKQIDAARKGQ
jgi:hypothetical protein